MLICRQQNRQVDVDFDNFRLATVTQNLCCQVVNQVCLLTNSAVGISSLYTICTVSPCVTVATWWCHHGNNTVVSPWRHSADDCLAEVVEVFKVLKRHIRWRLWRIECNVEVL